MKILNGFKTFFNKLSKKPEQKYFVLNSNNALVSNEGKYLVGSKRIEAYEEEIYIYGCVYLISNTIASLPIEIYKDSLKSEKIEHPFRELMKKPNFKDSFYDIIEIVSASLELDGNAFVLVGKGIPEQIFVLNPQKVEIVPNKEKNIQTYEDYVKSYRYGTTFYGVDEVIHEKKNAINNSLRGLSPVRVASLNIDLSQEAKRRNYNMIVLGVKSSGSFETDQPYDESAYHRLKMDLKQKYQGTEKAGEPLILFNGLKYKELGLDAQDIEYIAGLKLTREEICGFIYQVPIILLGVFEDASYNNIKEAQKIFYNFSIIPRIVKIRELLQKIVDRWGIDCYIDFDLNNVGVLKEEMKNRVEIARMLWSCGVPMKVLNEVYELGLPRYENDEVSYLPFSVMPVSNASNNEQSEGKVVKKRREFTEEEKVLKWKNFIRVNEKYERRCRKNLVDFFKEQKTEVLNNLNKKKNLKIAKIDNNNICFFEGLNGETKRIVDINEIYDEKKWIAKLIQLNFPLYAELFKEKAKQEAMEIGFEIGFDLTSQEVLSWLEKFCLDKAKSVIETLKERIKEQLIEGVQEGESILELQDRITQVYDGYVKPEGFETERIARTEVIGASNKSSLETYRQVGIKKKTWLTARDNRCRDTHREAELKYAGGIPLSEDFVVGAGKGECPGQIGLPEEDINCRCSILPVFEE